MFALDFSRTTALASVAVLLAACSGSSGAPGSAIVPDGGPQVSPQAVAGAPVGTSSDRAEYGPTGVGKVPQHFTIGSRASRPRGNAVACTTVSPSADVLSALSESGPTATAAYVIDTPNGTYAKQNYDGSECDIAVYVSPSASGVAIQDSTIHDAIRAGLVVDGASHVSVNGDSLYNVGDHMGTTYAPDGVQWGFALMLVNAGSAETVSNDSVFNYQKDGILAFDAVSLALVKNDVTGAGPVNYIASNGIEMDGVAFTALAGNRVLLNQYTGPNYGAAGYLFCGDTLGGRPVSKNAVKRGGNAALFNDIEIYISPNSNCS